jgi:DNA-binding LacI/PurR family transcriptional regulator
LEYSLLWKAEFVPPTDLSVVEKVEMLLGAETCPEVVVANSPEIAYEFVLAAHRRGLEPDRDVQVLCFAGAEQEVQVIAPM